MESNESESSHFSSHFLTIASAASAEIKIKNSRFLSFVFPVKSVEECQILLSRYQKNYHDASHVCFAYRIGTHERETFRYSDAGEPAGSAGAPIFKVINGLGLTNLLIIVVRYFGGIKLGIGGLVRAYTEAARMSLQNTKIIKQEIREVIEFNIAYDYLNRVLHEISAAGVKILDQDYSDTIQFRVSVPRNKIGMFRETLINSTAGTIEFKSGVADHSP